MNTIARTYAIEFLESWLQFRARNVDLPGFTVAVQYRDEIIFSRSYGRANIDFDVPMTPQHLFCVASQTKMITTTAIMRFVAEGLVRIDDPAVSYLPWLAEHQDYRFQEITIRQLLSHSAGLAHDMDESDFWNGRSAFPNSEALRLAVLRSTLALEPNTKLKYSNLGFALLGTIIETVCGTTYEDYIQNHLLDTINLSSAIVYKSDSTPGILAKGYTPLFDGKRSVLDFQPMDAFAASAGGLATPESMCRFMRAHCFGNNTLLLNAHKKEMQRSQWVVMDGYSRGCEYGLGLEILTIAGNRMIGHTGHAFGHTTATFCDPHTQLVVSISVNCKEAPIINMIKGIFEALFHFEQTASKLTQKQYDRFNTRLQNPLSTLQIVSTQKAITAIDPNDWEPFSWGEMLEKAGRNRLRIITQNSMHGTNEQITYRFNAEEHIQQVNYGGILFEPDSDGTETNRPFTLPRESAEILQTHYVSQIRKPLFKIEVLPDYDQTGEADIQGEQFLLSLAAWRRGQTRKAISILERCRKGEAETPSWMGYRSNDRSRGPKMLRIRVMDKEETPFMQWEKEYFKRISIPLGAERIVYMPRDYLRHLELPTGDLLICDDKIMVNRYKGIKFMHCSFYHSDMSEATPFLELKKEVLRLLTQHHLQSF